MEKLSKLDTHFMKYHTGLIEITYILQRQEESSSYQTSRSRLRNLHVLGVSLFLILIFLTSNFSTSGIL